MQNRRSMAKIYYITTVHPLHDHRFLYKQCAGLVKAGHEVHFVVANDKNTELLGVKIEALPSVAGRWKRILRSLLIFRKMLLMQADVYHLCDVELLPAGLIIKWFTRRQVVYDAHEDIASFMLMKPYLPHCIARCAKVLVEFFERMAAKTFDAFVMADPAVKHDHVDMPEIRKHVFYNVPLLSLFKENPIPWRERSYDVVFLGTMSITSGTLVLLDALAELKRQGRSIRALFIGKPLIPNFNGHLNRRNLNDVVNVTGRIEYGEVPALLDQCKIGLIGLLDLPKFHKNIATKMFEYMAKSLSVVSSNLPPERHFLQDGKHGYLVKAGDPSAFAHAIAHLLDNPDRATQMANEVRQYLLQSRYYAEKEQEKLSEFYAMLLKHPRHKRMGRRNI